MSNQFGEPINSGEERLIVFVLYPGLTPLDLIGPLQVLNALEAPYRAVVAGESVQAMATDTALSIVPDRTFDDARNPFAVIVPGGSTGAFRAMANDAVIDYLRAAADSAQTVASVCTGALILGAAGLLEGRNATTHWAYAPLLAKLGARYHRQRWVTDGKFVTAAGVSAGIDLGLHLAALWAGEETSRRIQLGIEYDPAPPFGSIDWKSVAGDGLLAHRTPEQRHKFLTSFREALANAPELRSRLEL